MRARFLNRAPEEIWWAIESEFGPPMRINDEDLKRLLTTELSIARYCGKQGVQVPVEIAERVLEEVIDKCRRACRRLEDDELRRRLRQRLTEATKTLPALRALRPARPKNRPKRTWWESAWQREACRVLEQRRRELMETKHLSRRAAVKEAATAIAPGFAVSPATIISWWANPGRRRRK